jgi:hypothetical protein
MLLERWSRLPSLGVAAFRRDIDNVIDPASPMPPSTSPQGLLDTGTVILLTRLDDPAALPEEPPISAITLAELSVGPLVADAADERARRQAHLQQGVVKEGAVEVDLRRP